jgi:hypothetical protein
MRFPLTISMVAQRASALAGIGICLALVGCGGGDKSAAPSAAKSSSTAAKTGTPAPGDPAASVPKQAQYISTFSTTDVRDPFFPHLKAKAPTVAANTTAAPPVGPNDIIAALEAGFQATMGPPSDRIALLYGWQLEQNRETIVTVTVQGAPRRIKVKPLRILRDAMEAQVEGIPNAVTLKVRR